MVRKTYDVTDEIDLNGVCDNSAYERDVTGPPPKRGTKLDLKTAEEGKDTCLTKVNVKRTVGLTGGISLIIGTMIGSGIFASASSVASNSGSVGMSLVVWTGSGILAMFGALCYIELGLMIPKSGGEYVYLMEAFGKLPAFLFVYTSNILLKPASIAAIVVTTGAYLVEPFYGLECNLDDKILISKLLSAFFLGLIVFINCASTRWATKVQVIFTAAKLVAIIVISFTGFVRLGQGYNESFKHGFSGTSTGISKIGYAFFGGLWAYDGWNNLNYVTEELTNPVRDLPLSIMIGIPLVTTCYVCINIAYLTVLSATEISLSSAVAVTLANQIYGAMAWIVPILVACSTFGAANGVAFTGGRLVFVSAREGHMPKLLAMVHKKQNTPLPALLFTCVIAWIMIIPESSNFEALINYFNFAAWIFYGSTFAALIWLRIKQPNRKRPYKVFIVIPIMMTFCSIYLVVAPFADHPVESTYCSIFILSGIPIYFLLVKYDMLPKSLLRQFETTSFKIQSAMNVVLPDNEESLPD